MARPQLIDRAGVLAAALAVADEEGPEALTMAAVAKRLGVTPMALYHHVANKADLLDGLVELLLTEFPARPADAPWAARLTALAAGIRATAQRHAKVFPLLLQRPAATPVARQARHAIYAALEEAGVASKDVAQIERLISTAILGFTVSEAAGRFRNHSRRQLDADFDLLQAMLGQLINAKVTQSA